MSPIDIDCPVLTEYVVVVHAAHYEGGGGHDLARWTVRHSAQPTGVQLALIGVPTSAEYHSGYRRDGVQHWIYVERRPMSTALCCLCDVAKGATGGEP